MIHLAEVKEESPVGEKAKNLASLTSAGFQVPPAFVVTPTNLLDDAMLLDKISDIGDFLECRTPKIKILEPQLFEG